MLLLLPLLRAHTVGYSSGGGESGTGQWCDAMTLCEHGAGHYGQATCPHGMHLVRQPEKSATYTVRAGDGTSASADPTAYAPGELVEIHVRTTSAWIQGRRSTGGIGLPQCYASLHSTDFGQCTGAANEYAMLESSKFIGLLLYAVDANEAKVGGWEISPAIPQGFWTPPDVGCVGKALMHKDPSPKNYHHVFHFRAPAAGAGALTFRALVKQVRAYHACTVRTIAVSRHHSHPPPRISVLSPSREQGDTNGGAFYWPVAPAMSNSGTKGVDLVLTEGVSCTSSCCSSSIARAHSPPLPCAADLAHPPPPLLPPSSSIFTCSIAAVVPLRRTGRTLRRGMRRASWRPDVQRHRARGERQQQRERPRKRDREALLVQHTAPRDVRRYRGSFLLNCQRRRFLHIPRHGCDALPRQQRRGGANVREQRRGQRPFFLSVQRAATAATAWERCRCGWRRLRGGRECRSAHRDAAVDRAASRWRCSNAAPRRRRSAAASHPHHGRARAASRRRRA